MITVPQTHGGLLAKIVRLKEEETELQEEKRSILVMVGKLQGEG